MAQSKITLYTSKVCPFAHRVHITLRALNLPNENVFIDLSKPREPWYLEINPRGLVPSMKVNDGVLKNEIITESAIAANYLADAYSSHAFWPESHSTPTSALTRARINFFVDTFVTKVNGSFYSVLLAQGEEQEKLGAEFVKSIEKELEPLLKGAEPFFGGSPKLTLAEAMTAPFVLRYQSFAKAGLFPKSMLEAMEALPNYSKWSKALHEEEAVTYIYDEALVTANAAERVEAVKAAKAA